MLHTHPGSTYSGVFYLADGFAAEEGKLAGRLALLPGAPPALPDYQRPHLRPGPERCADSAAEAALQDRVLLIEPTPGTCVVFPSFVPHFVIPTGPPPPDGTPAVAEGAPPRRLSVAFNFGSCEPVLAQVVVLPGCGGPRVKLVLETVAIYGL